MKQIAITADTPKFQAEAKRSGNGKVPVISPADLKALPVGAYILIGNKSAEYGGGLSGTGYIIQNGKATHSIGVSAGDAHRGMLRLP